MRKDWMLPSWLLILLLVMIVGAAILSAQGDDTISGSVKFRPNRIDLSLPSPSMVQATIRLNDPPDLDSAYKYINVSTILLEDPLSPTTTYFIKGALVAEFWGPGVISLIEFKIGHYMGGVLPPNQKIWLTITGKLDNTVGGTPFSATGYIKVELPHSPPPG